MQAEKSAVSVNKSMQKVLSEVSVPTYPRKLPAYKSSIIIDDYGMPQHEKIALRQAWRQMKPHMRRLGRETFYEFLTENHKYIDFFRGRDRKLNLRRLHRHALKMFKVIGYIIESCLDNRLEFIKTITRPIEVHRMKGVSIAYFDHLLDVMEQKFCAKVSNHYSASVSRGFRHLREQLEDIRKEYISRKQSFSGTALN